MPRLNHPKSSLASWGDAEVAAPWAGSSRAFPALWPEGPDTSHGPQLLQIFLLSWGAWRADRRLCNPPLALSGERSRAHEEPRFCVATALEFCSLASCKTKPLLQACRLHNLLLGGQLQVLAPVPEGLGLEPWDPCVASPLPPRLPNSSQRSPRPGQGSRSWPRVGGGLWVMAWCFQLWSRI